MKKRLIISVVFVSLLLLMSGTASARQLSVKKIVQNEDIKTGDSVNIALEFDNPFNTSILITIKDNNVLGSNGLEIQCYEYTLPDKPRMTLSYNFPITAFSEGDYTLDPASVTYTNPDNGAEETIKSQDMPISIKQGTASGQQQGVTTIYNCKGVSMQSTSYSSGGSSSMPVSSGQQQTNRQPQQPDNIQQTGSDMQNIKEEMEKQQQDYKNMQNELKNKIENNSDFRKMKEELEKQGYSSREEDIKPESNDTGSFKYDFRKDNESASISGNMNAGRMGTINKQSTEDIKKIQQYIENNETFKQMQKTLLDKGYNLSDKNIDLKSNISNFEYSFNDSQNRTASITGNVTNAGEIKDISLNEPKKSLPYWMLIFLAVPLIGIYLYKRYRNNSKSLPVEPVPTTMQTDPKEEALAKLERATEMFNNGMQKEAYTEASGAVRMYFRGTSGINELTSDEMLKSLQESKDETYLSDVRHCFVLCDLVKFAKYEPNHEDFNKVIEYAKRIIV